MPDHLRAARHAFGATTFCLSRGETPSALVAAVLLKPAVLTAYARRFVPPLTVASGNRKERS